MFFTMSEALQAQLDNENFLLVVTQQQPGISALGRILDMEVPQEIEYLEQLVNDAIITPVEAANLWLGVHYR